MPKPLRERRPGRKELLIASQGCFALWLAACQVFSPEPPTPSRLSIDRTSLAGSSTAGAKPAMVDITYRVRRGTVRDALSIPAKVVPARMVQVSFPSNGTVTAVHVRSGERVVRGTPLVEVSLTEEALREARVQAQLAELSYDAQQAKVDELKTGAKQSSVEDARAALAKARAAVRALEVARGESLRTLELEVSLAQLQLEQARDGLSQAQARARRGQEVASAESASAAASNRAAAAAATRSAERRLAEASLRLEQARISASRRAEQEVASSQLALDQARDDLSEAQATVRRGPDPLLSEAAQAAQRAMANAAVRAAERRVAEATSRLEQARAATAPGASAEVQLAQIGLDQARDDLARAQAIEERAGADGIAGRPADVALEVRPAERAVAAAALKLEQAQAAFTAAQSAQAARAELAALELQARQLEVAAAESRLNELRSGPSAEQLAREERRAAILREQADIARRSAQPEVTLTAPFDGTLIAVSTSVGQVAAARSAALRIAADAGLSVVANASEYEVPHLSADHEVEVSFPGLVSGTASGKIVDVSGIAVTEDGKVSYPVRIDLPSAPPGLKVGMSASVNVNLRQAMDVLYIPTGAVRSLDGRSIVTRIEPDGKVSEVEVQVGGTFGSNVEVVAGLADGDTVAVFAPPTTAAARKP